MRKKKTFQTTINEGDAVIKLKSNKVVELLFGEDEETIIRDMEWQEQEVYKTAVQFALMIDTFFKNGEGLDNLMMHSPTGSIAAELLNDDLAVTLGFAEGYQAFATEETNEEEQLSDRLDEMQDELNSNVVDASTRFTNKEEDETD